MLNRKKVNIFLVVSIVLLILIAVKFNYLEKIIDYKNDWINKNKSNDRAENDINDYPEYIYETFIDKDGNEVVIEMEKKTGTINGEDIIFYEDTAEPEVIYCHFYQGIIRSVDSEKMIFLVDKECKNADLNESFYDYQDVEDYEIEFNFNNYKTIHNEEFGIRDMIAINTVEIKDYKDFNKLIGKYLKVVDSEFRDNITKILVKGLDFYIR